MLVIDRPDSWHVEDLKRAAKNEYGVTTARFDQLAVAIDARFQKSEFVVDGICSRKYDALLTRAMPAASLQQIVFRMDWLDRLEKQHRIPVINPAKTIESSIDKYLSLEKLRAAGLTVPKTYVSQNLSEALRFFEELGNDCVLKPIFGSRGRGILRIREKEVAAKVFSDRIAAGDVIYQQEFVEHGDSDVRVLVVGDQLFGMCRRRPGHWIINASQGATCSRYSLDQQEQDIALTAARSQNAILAGIDLIYRSGIPVVLEVNAAPSWRHLAQVHPTDISATVLDCIRQAAEL